MPGASERFPLKPVRMLYSSVRADRLRHYKAVCAILRRWERRGFRRRLMESMNSRRRPAAQRSRTRRRAHTR
jgi:hypothetical protein